ALEPSPQLTLPGAGRDPQYAAAVGAGCGAHRLQTLGPLPDGRQAGHIEWCRPPGPASVRVEQCCWDRRCSLGADSALVDEHGRYPARGEGVQQADASHAAADDQDLGFTVVVMTGAGLVWVGHGATGGRLAASIWGLPPGGPGSLLTRSPAAVSARRTAPLTLKLTSVPPGAR